jgi:hypothetical protein
VGHWEVDNSNTDPTRRNIRVKQTTGGFDADGDLIYYSIFSGVPDQSFFDLNNPNPLLDENGDPLLRQEQPLTVGQQAQETMDLAEKFRAFLFPIQGRDGDTRYVTDPCGDAVAPGPGVFAPGGAAYNCFMKQPPPVNRRQDNLFETTDTYSCRNVTGLWKLTFVTFTQKGLTDAKAIKKGNELALKNGRTLDGLPVFKTLTELLTFQGGNDGDPNTLADNWVLFSFPLDGTVLAGQGRPPTAAPRWVV